MMQWMTEILHDPAYAILPEYLGFRHKRSCRSYIIKSMAHELEQADDRDTSYSRDVLQPPRGCGSSRFQSSMPKLCWSVQETVPVIDDIRLI